VEKRIVDRTADSVDEAVLEASLRPRTLNDYIGQEQVKENLRILIEAARKNHLSTHYCQRNGREHQKHFWPGA
jgi:Holliday junction DNA helicase RuvB